MIGNNDSGQFLGRTETRASRFWAIRPRTVRGAIALVVVCLTVAATVSLEGGHGVTAGERAGASQLTSTTQSISYAWGSNSNGQLGNGSTWDGGTDPDLNPLPLQVKAPPGVTFTKIAGGGSHVLALGSDKNLYAWGADGFGQLGDNSTTDTNTPKIITTPSSAAPFTSIAAGSSFSLALGSDGQVYAWGSNFFGQIGQGTATGPFTTPTQVLPPTGTSGLTFTAIAAGGNFAMALGSDHNVYAWGDNRFGQLGDGTQLNRSTPVQVQSPTSFGGSPVTQIAAGSSHSLALTASGTVYAWGDNDSGQLGDGTFTEKFNPVQVCAPVPSACSPDPVLYSAVAAGADFSVALTTTGSVETWGNNDIGQLGDGNLAACNDGDILPTPGLTRKCSAVPVGLALSGVVFTSIAAGYSSGYALTNRGTIWAWGDDHFGQIGVGDSSQQAVIAPEAIPLAPGTNDAAVYAGSQSSFGLLVTGQDQTISPFPAETGETYASPPFTVALSASSGLPVVMTSSTQSVCVTTGMAVSIRAQGSCVLTASQAGSNVYNPAPDESVIYAFGQAPLTIVANNVRSTQGRIPPLTYGLTGFVKGDSAATAGITGSASCSTPATSASPLGAYPITCTAGSLAAPNYEFSNSVGGTLTLTAATNGYHLVASDGGIFSFGDAQFYGSTGGLRLNQPIVGMADTPGGGGYWLVASDGGIFSYGNAAFEGSTGGIHLNEPIVGMAVDPATGGYWLVASDGGIFSFGAPFYGSTGALRLNKPIVGMAPTPDGHGYWLVASDGGIFAFGDAPFYGSTGSITLNKPIIAMASTHDGSGYWMVASDGGIFAFGSAPFMGSAAALHLPVSIVGMLADPTGNGYWMASANGAVYAFGSAFYGSLLTRTLNAAIIGIG